MALVAHQPQVIGIVLFLNAFHCIQFPILSSHCYEVLCLLFGGCQITSLYLTRKKNQLVVMAMSIFLLIMRLLSNYWLVFFAVYTVQWCLLLSKERMLDNICVIASQKMVMNKIAFIAERCSQVSKSSSGAICIPSSVSWIRILVAMIQLYYQFQ